MENNEKARLPGPGDHPHALRNAVALIALLAALSFASFVVWLKYPWIAHEDQILELGQSVCLVLAFAVHARQAWRAARFSTDFWIRSVLALLCYSFALRELDIDKFGASPNWALAEQVLRTLGKALWIGVLIVAALRVRLIFAHRVEVARNPVVRLTIAGGLLYIASWPFDKNVFSLSHVTTLIEEAIELDAGIVLLVASLVRSTNERRHGPVRR